MKKVKMIVTFISYTRACAEEFHGVKIHEGDSINEVLAKILDIHCYGVPTDENDKPIRMTTEEMLEKLNDENGDGCDYVMSIIDGNTGQMLYCCDEAPDSYPAMK
jgi:hypothetical protein